MFQLALACCAMGALPKPIFAAPMYSLERMISPVNPNDGSHATDINDAGYAIVNFYNRSNRNPWYPYLWKDGQGIPINIGYGLRINNYNQMTGYDDTPSGIFWNGIDYIRLEELAGGQHWNRPHALNDAGNIYGYSLTASSHPNGSLRAVGWTESGDLFDMGIGAMGTLGNEPQAANNSNQVVGYADGRNTRPTTSFAWSWQNGVVEVLPSLPGAIAPYSAAYGINNHGQIVGLYNDDTGTGPEGGAALWQNGELTVLDDPVGSDYGIAYDVSDSGYIVGLAYSGGRFHWTATLWDRAGKPYMLDDLVVNLNGWKLERALAINNKNQIVGIANDQSGTQHGFLLTPLVPEPSTITVVSIAVLPVLRRNRKTYARCDG
jgi:probable HAF family extracellular repeat protein